MLRVWHYPAFAPYRAWTVYKDSAGAERGEYKLVRVTWDQRRDLHRLHSDPMNGSSEGFHAEPTITFNELTLPKSAVDTVLNRLRRERIDLFVETDSIGIDGETYGIDFGDYMSCTRVAWWCQGPKQWKRFTDLVVKLISILEQAELTDRPETRPGN
ncbi:MAG: hypothetical protein ACYTEL_06620 [Planctomycetota bacterium]